MASCSNNKSDLNAPDVVNMTSQLVKTNFPRIKRTITLSQANVPTEYNDYLSKKINNGCYAPVNRYLTQISVWQIHPPTSLLSLLCSFLPGESIRSLFALLCPLVLRVNELSSLWQLVNLREGYPSDGTQSPCHLKSPPMSVTLKVITQKHLGARLPS